MDCEDVWMFAIFSRFAGFTDGNDFESVDGETLPLTKACRSEYLLVAFTLIAKFRHEAGDRSTLTDFTDLY